MSSKSNRSENQAKVKNNPDLQLIQLLKKALFKDYLDVEKTEEAPQRLAKPKKASLNMNLKKLVGVTDISAARANIYSLTTDMIHLYLNIKRFNGENKAANLTNFQ